MRKQILMLCFCVLLITMCLAVAEDNIWTCAYDGTINWTNICGECGRTKEEATNQDAAACAKGYHDWDITAVRASTCKEAGYVKETCSRCGTTKETSLLLDASNHGSYGTTVKNQKNATCVVKGYTGDTVCKGCGKTLEKGKDISALGHSWNSATCTSAKKCSRCGVTDGAALGHNYKAATCTEPKTCTRCGDISGNPLGHSWKAATCTTAKKCSRCGTIEGEALGHNYKAATCTEPITCTRCGDKIGNPLAHSWKAATCTTAKTCSRCGVTDGAALGHSWKNATCIEPMTCTRCGTTSGSALGHDWQAATYDLPERCSRCDMTRGEPLKPIIAVRDEVKYGRYPQTSSGTDNTPIEWIVLEVQGGKALLISKYALDCKQYNTSYLSVTWEKCTLRTWLNDEFINRAFSTQEQSAILTTTVDNSLSQNRIGWGLKGSINTQDRIFLLSYAEANQYLDVEWADSDNKKARVAPTDYAISQGALTRSDYTTKDDKAAADWWLRSPGPSPYEASCVQTYGSLDYYGITRSRVVVRPAFWINLNTAVLG